MDTVRSFSSLNWKTSTLFIEVLQPFEHLMASSGPSAAAPFLLVLGVPELNTALQVESHKNKLERRSPHLMNSEPGCLGRLQSIHSWGYSKFDWIQLWSAVVDSALSAKTRLDNLQTWWPHVATIAALNTYEFWCYQPLSYILLTNYVLILS